MRARCDGQHFCCDLCAKLRAYNRASEVVGLDPAAPMPSEQHFRWVALVKSDVEWPHGS